MPFPFATLIPIAGAITREVVQGINNRKARLYNSPANQIKRLREAGLPTAAGSNITGGQQVPTQVSGNFGTEGFNDNLGKSITRQIDRKKLQIHGEELTQKAAEAAIAAGNAKNQLNPNGIFEGTNQGLAAMQALGTQSEALKSAQIVNQFMPSEKYQSLMKGTLEMNKIAQDTKNAVAQHGILLSEGKIKNILANYQENMSLNQLQGLIKDNLGKDLRNAGMDYDNASKRIAYTIELRTMAAQIEMALNAAKASGQNLEAGRLSLLLTQMSMPSTQAYYEIRRGMDDATKAKPNMMNTLLYLGMFTPTQSNYNFGQLIPRFPSGGNNYNRNVPINEVPNLNKWDFDNIRYK